MKPFKWILKKLCKVHEKDIIFFSEWKSFKKVVIPSPLLGIDLLWLDSLLDDQVQLASTLHLGGHLKEVQCSKLKPENQDIL